MNKKKLVRWGGWAITLLTILGIGVTLLPYFWMVSSSLKTGAEVFETCMSTRANSSASYLYGMPYSAVFLLTISVHLSAFGIVKMV